MCIRDRSGGDRSYAFLFDAVQRHLQRTRQRAVREAISQSLGDAGKPAAPGAKGDKGGGDKGKGKGDGPIICRYFAAGKCLKGDKCTYKHAAGTLKGGKDAGKKGKGKGKGKDLKPNKKRSGSAPPGGNGHASEKKGKELCRMFQLGKCRWGDKCQYEHVKPAAPATGSDDGGAKEQAKTNVRPKKKPAGPAVLPACAVRFSDYVEIIEIDSCMNKAEDGFTPRGRHLAPLGAGRLAAASLAMAAASAHYVPELSLIHI